MEEQTKQTQDAPQPEKKKSLEEQNVAYFKIYIILPKILFWLTLIAYCILGIFDAANVRETVKGTVYGAMGLSNGFLCWFVWMLIGLVNAAINYYLLRIPMSYQVLKILYLQKLLKANKQTFLPIEENVPSKEKTA